MASTTSKADSEAPVIDMAAFGVELAARRAALGNPELPRNSGLRRTESKKALLAAINEAAAKQGFSW